ncbi:MAG: hypothetical protein ACOVLC_08075 [Flavobacterium sp.]
MMISGSSQAMIDSIRNNKMLLSSKSLFKKERTFLSLKSEYLKSNYGNFEYKKATKEELLAIRNKIIRDKKKQFMIKMIIVTVFMFFLSLIVYQFVEYELDSKEKNQKFQFLKDQKTFYKNEKEFLSLLKYGDDWFEKRHWHNAIFCYKKAVELFPSNFEGNYRLALAYSLQCEFDFKNCNEAKMFLDTLYAEFPNKKDELASIKDRLSYEYQIP